MHWSLNPATYSLRGYAQADGYATHAPYIASGEVVIVCDTAVIWRLGRYDGRALTREDRAGLARILSEHGVRRVLADRHGQLVELKR